MHRGTSGEEIIKATQEAALENGFIFRPYVPGSFPKPGEVMIMPSGCVVWVHREPFPSRWQTFTRWLQRKLFGWRA